MIIFKIIFGSLCLLLTRNCAYGIYDPNDPEAGVKAKGYHRNQDVSEPIVMHHQYSKVASNRPLDTSSHGTRQGRTSYTNEAENYVAQHGLECPRNATGQYPYLLNCRQFLNCWKGRGYIQSCAPGTVFNPDSRECDNPKKVICLNYRREEGSNDHSAKLQLNDKEISSAVANSETNPSDSVQCSPGYSGIEPHPFDCSKFLNCANGITYIQDCGPGTVFNSLISVCDYPYNVDCSKRNGRVIVPGNEQNGQHFHHSHQHSQQPSNNEQIGWQNPQIPDNQANGPKPGWNVGERQIDSHSNGHQHNWQNHHHHLRPDNPYPQQTTSDRSWQQPTRVSSQGKDNSQSAWNQPSSDDRPPQTVWQAPSSNFPTQNHPYDAKLAPFPDQTYSQSAWQNPSRNPSIPNQPYDGSIPSTNNQGWQQSIDSSSSNGNRQFRTDLDQQHLDDNDEPFYVYPEKSDTNPVVVNEFEIGHAQVDEIINNPISKNISARKNKTIVYHAQPVGSYNESDLKPISQDLLPPPLPSQDHARKNKTIIYYAQPVESEDDGVFNSEDLLQRVRVQPPFYQRPTKTRNQPSVTQQENDDVLIDDNNWEQRPSELLIPADRVRNHSWAELTPSASRNHWYPVRNLTYPSSHNPHEHFWNTTKPTINNHLKPPPRPSMSPTESLIPVPSGVLLPPIDNFKTTNKQNPTNPPVIYPPPEPTNPLSLRPAYNHPIYPPLSSDSNQLKPTQPIFYSPSYSGVSHTRPKGRERQFSDEEGEEEWSKKVLPIYTRPSQPSIPSMKTTPKYPEPYNHDYYKPPEARTAEPNGDEVQSNPSTLPISEALKVLLRPYFNRSGTVTDDVADTMDEHIMKISKTSTKPTAPTETEAEIIFAGEQDDLNNATRHHDQSYEISDENPTENSNHHQPHGSRHFPHHHQHHHQHHHNFHDHNHSYHHSHHHPEFNHSRHHHHNHQWNYHHPPHHSREFHQRNPNIPNPFATNDLGDDSDTTGQGKIDVRINLEPANNSSDRFPSLDADKPKCQFDCKNGKCISEFQICDGVNNCGNRLDESQCDYLGYEARLSSDENKANMGRVEVKVNGKWGYVCDDKFGMRAADVLCRELGFTLGAGEVRANSYYPPNREMFDGNDVRYLMDEVDCLGNETSIRECNFQGWGVHDCSPEEVVGVVCKVPVMTCPANHWLCKTSQECVPIGFLCDSVIDCQDGSDEDGEICNGTIQYRLQGGSPMEGRVEVKYRDTWGTVCDDDFGKKEAQVICRSLGFLGDAIVLKNAYGAGTGPIWLDQVSCAGNESSLVQCSHFAWGEHNCNHSEDVSVRCNEKPVNPLAEPTTTPSSHPEKIPEDDIDLYLYKMQRSSKALNQNKRCGQINEHAIDEFKAEEDEFARVVNGTKALRGHHPWQASLRAKGRNGMSSHWCGAILITQLHVLTAAHCLVGYQKGALFIRLGDHYSKIAEPSEVDSFIQNWYIHDDFRKGHHMNNDIALIVLKSPVIFNDYIQPVCLPPNDAKYEEGMQCTISGWGSIKSGISTPSNNLKAAHVPIISQAVCKEPYVYGKAITEGMFCAGYLDEGVDACDGDSGGPLACSTPNGETLYGIISWGQHCGQANKPGVYVKVAYYLDWIMEKIMFSLKSKEQ